MANNFREIKFNRNKNGALSIIFGIIGLIYLPFLFLFGEKIWEIIGMLYIGALGFLFGIFSLLALIFGILGLKSPKRELAILGIILSLIGLLIIVGFNLIVYVLGPLTF